MEQKPQPHSSQPSISMVMFPEPLRITRSPGARILCDTVVLAFHLCMPCVFSKSYEIPIVPNIT